MFQIGQVLYRTFVGFKYSARFAAAYIGGLGFKRAEYASSIGPNNVP